MARRNPAPLSGALFVRNPRRRNSSHGRRRNALAVQANRGAVKRLLARIKSKGGSGRRKTTSKRRNGWSLRQNGLRRNSAGRFMSARRNGRRRNAIAVQSNGYGRKFKSTRKFKRRGTRKGMRRKTARRAYMRTNSRRRNGDLPRKASGMVSRIVRKVPFVGKQIAPAITPALTGAMTFVPVHYALKYAAPYIPEMVKPFAYTAGGFMVSAIAAMLPKNKMTGSFKSILGITAVTVGAGVDVFRYFQGSSGSLGAIDLPGYGDGMAYDLGGLALQGGDMGAIAVMGDYSDAVMADAAFSGPDLSSLEGHAALGGAGAWRGRFKRPAHRAAGQYKHESKHAGKSGHRWGWLIKLVGWDHFRKIAALPADQRTALIGKIRKDAVAAVVGLTEADVQIETGMSGLGLDMSGLGSTIYAGAAY